MGAYYHDLPICPTCCKSPNIAEGSYIDIPNGEGGSRICSECKVKFKASINLEGRCVFHDLSILISSNGWIDPSKVPLFWRIWPNRIERDYLEWVRNPRPGNHLVTWPWPEVRFAPLLAFEFLEANPKCKVLIVDSLGPNRNETDTIYSFDLVDRIGGLYKTTEDIDQKSIQKDPGNKKAWHSLSKVDILEKQLTTEYYVTRAGKDHDYAVDRSRVERHGIMPFRLSTCEGRIVKEIAEEVGKDRIRKVTRIKAGKSKVIKTLNPNGVYDIRLDEEERWVKDVTRTISKDDFWNIVLQRTRPRRAGDFILAAPQNNESIPAIKDDSNLIIVDISSSDTDYR
ncbi:MAG TPA: hypothetical protein PLJ11_05020, partial [Methanomassiliicoccales archaeon]|nr:hypothetical protein [Methanomassiliicoccales archaeon]